MPLDSSFSFGFVLRLCLGPIVVVTTLPIANGEQWRTWRWESVELLGDGESVELIGDGDLRWGLLGDRIATEDGVSTVGEELFKVQRLSAIGEPALLSISVALQIVQFIHESEFIAAENVSGGQLPHTRSVVTVPLVSII